MEGLMFSRIYLDQIINGERKNDTRMHPTRVRGLIALVERESRTVRATAVLSGIEPVPYREFAERNISAVRSDVPLAATPEGSTCWSYILDDLRILRAPMGIGDRDAHMWVDLPDDMPDSFEYLRRGPESPIGTCWSLSSTSRWRRIPRSTPPESRWSPAGRRRPASAPSSGC